MKKVVIFQLNMMLVIIIMTLDKIEITNYLINIKRQQILHLHLR